MATPSSSPRAGFDTLGIDGRVSNIAKCEYVAKKLALPNVHFVRDDVRNLADHGIFDVIFCSGLFYHLDRPAEFLELLARCTRRLLILNTCLAYPDRGPVAVPVSDMSVNEGMAGRWYEEWSEDTTPEMQEELAWASVGNRRSFWPTKGDLLQKLRDVGFCRDLRAVRLARRHF